MYGNNSHHRGLLSPVLVYVRGQLTTLLGIEHDRVDEGAKLSSEHLHISLIDIQDCSSPFKEVLPTISFRCTVMVSCHGIAGVSLTHYGIFVGVAEAENTLEEVSHQDIITCVACIELSHVLPCCIDNNDICESCAAFEGYLASLVQDPGNKRQMKEDHAASLKVQHQELDREDKRLAAVFKEKNATLEKQKEEVAKISGAMYMPVDKQAKKKQRKRK
ncbi:MAG: hypothetical protein M1839_003211 [Geoglossum umbratile]|nr:MAG: hypothetical protein M1839_003211 [Geoglossum umbratile]